LHANYKCQFGQAYSDWIEALREAMADLLSIPCQVLRKRDAALELMQSGGQAGGQSAGLDRTQRISA